MFVSELILENQLVRLVVGLKGSGQGKVEKDGR